MAAPSFIDSAVMPRTLTVGGNTVTSTAQPYGTATLFIDGLSQATAAIAAPNVLTAPVFAIGNLMPGTDPSLAWPGFIDEVRIFNIARWTSDFAVPTGPYDNQQLFNTLPQLSALLAL